MLLRKPEPKPYTTVHMLELSTSHLTSETAELLARKEDKAGCTMLPVYYDKTGCGWFVYAIDPPDGIPSDLAEVLAFARGAGCVWVMFDCDVEPIDGLKTYQW